MTPLPPHDAELNGIRAYSQEWVDGTLTPEEHARRLQISEFIQAHDEGLHAEVPREGCPECERR